MNKYENVMVNMMIKMHFSLPIINTKPMTVISSFLPVRTRPFHAMFNSISLASLLLLR